MPHERRGYRGAAPETTLAGGIGPSDLTISVTNGTGYPSGPEPFFIAIDQGTSTEEKIRCSSRSGNTIIVATGGRGADNTVAASHIAGVNTKVNHVLTALDLDEANSHYAVTTYDHHTQYMRADGGRHDGTARHVALGWGALGAPAQVIANQTGIGTTITDLTGLTKNFTLASTRFVKVTAHGHVQQLTTEGTPILYLRNGTTQLGRLGQESLPAGYGTNFDGNLLLTLAAGTYTLKLSLNTTAGTCQFMADPLFPAQLIIEDSGPA